MNDGWKYDPMTGRLLSNPDGVTPWEQYAFERGYFRALEVVRQTSKSEWQGLTDEEAEQITDAHWNDPAMFIEAIEAKLKEKNT